MLSQIDQNDLVLALFATVGSATPWALFIDRLRARTRADRVHLWAGSHERAVSRHFLLDAADQAEELRQAEALWVEGLAGQGLRPHRVYALDELEAHVPPHAARIGDARLVQVRTAGDGPLWLALIHERAQFDAADGALLTALIPAIQLAAANHAHAALLTLRMAAAEDALTRLGIGQSVQDINGRVLASDPFWQEAMRSGDIPQRAMLRSMPNNPGASIASIRRERTLFPESAAPVIALSLGLSPREAQLAAHLATGIGLNDAAAAMGLTRETARNYSKRIFLKANVSGQPDLVRRVLSGLAPLMGESPA